MSPQAPTLVFFDIDGTLVHMDGAGRKAFILALEDAFGLQDDIAYINFSGSTDLDVLERIGRRRGLRITPDDARRFFDALAQRFEDTVAEARPRVYPGVHELLETLANDDGVLLGLVTGNIEACARRKLACFDLHGHFYLGAFGHEHADRNEIARLALARATRHLGPGPGFRRRFLVGDTPADIAAAHAIEAVAVGVATGTRSTDELRAAGADYVFDDFSDLPEVLRVLEGTPAAG